MVWTSAKLAVKRRALRAATWLDLWADHFLGELEKQAIEPPRRGGLPKGSTDRDLHVRAARRGRPDPRHARMLGRASTVREVTGVSAPVR
jgi:hypothetical protein